MSEHPGQFAVEQTARGVVGGASTFLAAAAPWQDHVDWWIDAASRLVALGIGVAVLASIVVGVVRYIRRL